jgi:hypothetical protein
LGPSIPDRWRVFNRYVGSWWLAPFRCRPATRSLGDAVPAPACLLCSFAETSLRLFAACISELQGNQQAVKAWKSAAQNAEGCFPLIAQFEFLVLTKSLERISKPLVTRRVSEGCLWNCFVCSPSLTLRVSACRARGVLKCARSHSSFGIRFEQFKDREHRSMV